MTYEQLDEKSKLRLLRRRFAQLIGGFRTDNLTEIDRIQGKTLAILIEHAIRQIERQKSSIFDWTSLAVAVHLGNDLLAGIRRHEADELKGWTYARPLNLTQSAYSFVYGILLDIGKSMVQIEDAYPQYQRWFDSQRDKRQDATCPSAIN